MQPVPPKRRYLCANYAGDEVESARERFDMQICCEEINAQHVPDSVKELLCKASAIGFSKEELTELLHLYGQGLEAEK